MSVITEKSPKHCATKQAIKLNKKLFMYSSILSLTILSLIFLVWLILHPKNPNFSLKQAHINHLNTSTIHLTLQSTNPNNKFGILYDQLLLSASHNGQNITPQTSIPPFFQDHDNTTLLSALLTGHQHDQLNRTEKQGFDFKLTGRLRWKLGDWVSGRYKFNVICVTVFSFGNIGTTEGSVCSTSV